MRGSDLAVGAVAGVTRLRNPVLAAREILLAGGPVLLIGEGRNVSAVGAGWKACRRTGSARRSGWRSCVRFRPPGAVRRSITTGRALAAKRPDPPTHRSTSASKFGTVGAVALDTQGHLAAATSTGGLTNKLPGRVDLRRWSAQEPTLPTARWRFSSVPVSAKPCPWHGGL